MIFIIDDDEIMGECIANYCNKETQIFHNAIEAMNAISDGSIPDLIFLDILLDGPDGFTFLHELASYNDTAKIPVVVVSSINFAGQDLSIYGVVGILNKDNMMPEDVQQYVNKFTA